MEAKPSWTHKGKSESFSPSLLYRTIGLLISLQKQENPIFVFKHINIIFILMNSLKKFLIFMKRLGGLAQQIPDVRWQSAIAYRHPAEIDRADSLPEIYISQLWQPY